MSDSFTLSRLAPLMRWVLWRNEQRDGRAAKIPRQVTGNKASCTDPQTWATRAACEAAHERMGADGVGIVLGDLGNGYTLAGIDLDSCITAGTTDPWAQKVLDQFGSYAETSPSGTGYKMFFLLRGGDMPRVRDLLDGKQGRSWKQVGGEHPPAIELYTGGRYFTVTDKALGGDGLAVITPDEIAWLTGFAAETFSPPREAGDHGRDNSRSARAFDIAGRIRAGGGTYADFIAACREDDSCNAWLLEKGLAHDEREARRAWQNSSRDGFGKAGANGKRSASVMLLRGDQVKSEPIAWLWQGWLARAKVHVFAGDPGAGKTTIALDLASIITRGGHWPDGTTAEPGDVLFWSGEDDIADTLKPRLQRAGADLARVYFIAGISEDGRKRQFDPAKDMAGLGEAIGAMKRPALVVVDPMVSALSGDSHNNAETRRGLQPLADLAMERRVAVLGIHHLSKGTHGRKPLERVTGSLAIGALARLVIFAARGEGENDRLLIRVKSNIGPDGDGFRYSLEQAPLPEAPEISASGIAWGEAVKGSAAGLLAKLEGVEEPRKGEAGGGADSPAVADAKAFLETMLADGPMLQKLLEAEAKEAGVSWASVRRAKTALGITAERIPPKPASDDCPASEGAWQWCFPAAAFLAKLRAEAQAGGEVLDPNKLP
jgi:putative DNA primase/helicase